MTATPARPTSLPRGSSARPANSAGPLGSTIDPVKVVRGHLWLLIGVTVVGAALGGVSFFLTDRYYPLYAERVVFEVRPSLQSATEVVASDLNQEETVVRLARTEIEKLRQRTTLASAVSRVDVQKTEWAQGFFRDGVLDVQAAVDDLTEELSADMIRNTNLFYLSWSAPVANDVPTVLNQIAQEYIEQRKRDDDKAYENARSVFETQIEGIGEKIFSFSGEVNEIIGKVGLTSLDDARDAAEMVGARGIEQQLNDATINIAMTQSEIKTLETQMQEAVREVSDDERRRAEDDPNIRALTSSVNDFRVRLATARDRFDETHPQVVNYDQMLRAAEQEREQAIKTWVARDRQARYKMAVSRLEQLQKAFDDVTVRAATANERLKTITQQIQKVTELRDRISLLQTQRQSLQASINETEMLRTRDEARRTQIAKRAETPREKSFPKLKVFVPLGGMGAALLVLGVIFLREVLDQRVKSSRDLAVIPGAKVVGSVPDLEDDPTGCASVERAVRDHPNSVVAESFRQANAQVMREMAAGGHVVLVVVGGLPNSGTTSVVANLGATDAAAGKRVLLIDANFRRPRLPEAIGVTEDGPGLGDLLCGDSTLDEVLVDAGDGLHLLHAGTPASRVLERLNSPRLDSVLAELRPRYDVILIDAPPAVVAGEAMVLASKADAALLVVRANQEQRGLVARLVRQLTDMRCQLVGILLNRPRGTAGGYLKKNYAAMAEYAKST